MGEGGLNRSRHSSFGTVMPNGTSRPYQALEANNRSIERQAVAWAPLANPLPSSSSLFFLVVFVLDVPSLLHNYPRLSTWVN